MLKRLIIAVLIGGALLGAFGASANAQGTSTASFDAMGAWGLLNVTSAGPAQYAVWGEQSDGGYTLVAVGALPGGGAASIPLPVTGPTTDGLPQFYVVVGSGGRPDIFAISDPSEEWWLD